MKAVREHQAPSEVLMKSICVTAAEQRELAKHNKEDKLAKIAIEVVCRWEFEWELETVCKIV